MRAFRRTCARWCGQEARCWSSGCCTARPGSSEETGSSTASEPGHSSPERAASPPAHQPTSPSCRWLTVALAALGADDRIAFPRLQQLVGMTAGNLSTHVRKLEDAGYVAVTKAYQRRTPVTRLSLTRTGRRALEDYTAALQCLLGTTNHQPDPEDSP